VLSVDYSFNLRGILLFLNITVYVVKRIGGFVSYAYLRREHPRKRNSCVILVLIEVEIMRRTG
jgi:hypothetical protein